MANSKGQEADAPRKKWSSVVRAAECMLLSRSACSPKSSATSTGRESRKTRKERFELVGLSGTSAGALCALMTWYGLAAKNGKPGSPQEAIETLNDFWWDFLAKTCAENVLNFLTYRTFWAEQLEIPVLGISSGQVFRQTQSLRRNLQMG